MQLTFAAAEVACLNPWCAYGNVLGRLWAGDNRTATLRARSHTQKILPQEIAVFFVLSGISDQAAQWKTSDGCNLDLIILHFHTNIPVGLEDQKYQQSVTKCQHKNA